MDSGQTLFIGPIRVRTTYILYNERILKKLYDMREVETNKFVFNKSLNGAFLEELFEGDSAYAQTVFEDFLRDLPPYWARVETAFSGRNMQDLRTCIHTCKTLFGYVGFTDIQEFCQDFENSCSGNTPEGLLPSYRTLLQKKEAAQRVIEDEYKRLKLFNANR
jgi:hypothetical protein